MCGCGCAASAAEEALALEREAAAALAAAWSGESSSAAVAFADRHCAAATAVAAALRNAADSCAALRDTLWRLVGDKVHAAVAIDDRRAEVRPAWLAAAQTVMSGAPDRAEAADIVTHQITPYVDADIRTDWLAAMRAATTSIAAAYNDALNRLSAHPSTHFDVPGQLVPPMPDRPRATTVATPAPAAVTVPAAAPPRCRAACSGYRSTRSGCCSRATTDCFRCSCTTGSSVDAVDPVGSDAGYRGRDARRRSRYSRRT